VLNFGYIHLFSKAVYIKAIAFIKSMSNLAVDFCSNQQSIKNQQYRLTEKWMLPLAVIE